MKKRKQHPHLRLCTPSQPIYPNTADRRYYLEKAVNILTAIVSGIGFTSAMLFLFTMT